MAKTPRRVSVAKANGIKRGYRSGLEDKISAQLEGLGIPFEYENFKIKWVLHQNKVYTPDFKLPNGIIVESKGRFLTDDRMKHLEVKKQHPHLDIRFVFSNPKTKIKKGSKTSYADWCDKHGFKWADKLIPEEWLNEQPNDKD